MSVTPQECRVIILVKALPQPSKAHGETVCCAGVTAEGKWKRLFPIRFRHLKGDSAFKRWDWVSFRYTRPTHDIRPESCRVHEESLAVVGKLPKSQHAAFLKPLVLPSINAAIERGQSLALIRPRNTRFTYKRKSNSEIAEEREAFEQAAKQTSLFDTELAALSPTPFPRERMLFAVGNQAKRPQVWQLLGVLKVDDLRQEALAL